MKKILLSTALLVTLCQLTIAKIKVSVEGGTTLVHYHMTEKSPIPYYRQQQSYTAGTKGGLNFSFRLTNHFRLEPGLYYSFQQFTWKATTEYRQLLGTFSQPYYSGYPLYPEFSDVVKVHIAEIPLYLTYKTAINKHYSLSASAGGILGCHMFGREKNGLFDPNGEPLDIGRGGGFSRCYVQLGGRVGWHFNNGVYLRAFFQQSVTNLLAVEGRAEGEKLSGHSFGLLIGYQLSKQKK
ncbi:MAG: hypothetical protein EBZ77_12230 [Chitinophagia bacterium]|nr:hypothetical protein [Chitinophagia bacterium]